jgi:hypothetical protein
MLRVAKVKKKIIRRRRSKSSNQYFSAQTQAHIVEYQQCENSLQREKIYVKEIMPAFLKLAENLIFIYGFANPGDKISDLINDCVTFLYETLYKWDESKGSKAFSYFNVVAKNWLIIHARRVQKKNRRHVSSDDQSRMSQADRRALEFYDILPPPDEILMQANFRNEIMLVLCEIQKRVTGENERKCIDAVITVFKQIDQLDFLNKRAIFVYVRDISGLTPKQLSVSMSVIRKHYRQIVKPGSEFALF